MHRRILALVAVLALGLVGLATTAAAKRKPKAKADHGTIRAAPTSAKGKVITFAGQYGEKGPIGSGAILLHVRTSPDSSGATKDNAKITVYTKRGSLSGSGSALQVGAKLNKGKFTLKKGTGAYKGWKETGTFRGSVAGSGVLTLKFKGKVTK